METLQEYKECSLCPRSCKTDRRIKIGYCGCSDQVKLARAALHLWEEPCISGKKGSGAVFFSGCTIRCCFCQNYKISSEGFGKEITIRRLADIFMELQQQGAHNINLVTATQYLPSVKKALDLVKDSLNIPVVFNCGGYEKVETIKQLKNYVDIYLPDLKYYDPKLSAKYLKAPDYFDQASKAVIEMTKQAGKIQMDEDGLMKKGVIIRHMVMPGTYRDSIQLLHWIKENLKEGTFLLSLLSQYTPYYKSCDYPEINRRITTYEYDKVLDEAISLGLTEGFMQEKSSAKEEYTPSFNLQGV